MNMNCTCWHISIWSEIIRSNEKWSYRRLNHTDSSETISQCTLYYIFKNSQLIHMTPKYFIFFFFVMNSTWTYLLIRACICQFEHSFAHTITQCLQLLRVSHTILDDRLCFLYVIKVHTLNVHPRIMCVCVRGEVV